MLKQLLKDIRFYLLILGVVLFGVIFVLVMNYYVMPAYTRHNHGLTVPDITKLPLNEAKVLLNKDGLRDSVVDRRYTSSYPPNYVIDQNPTASSIVKSGRFIYLTVNAPTAPKVTVPDVVNMSLRNAVLQLENYGLEVGNRKYVSGQFKNSVISQSIPAGISVTKGVVVSLTVSDGLGINKVKVPKLTGLLLYQAQSKIRNAGLRIGEIMNKPDAKTPPNTVISYSPSKKDSLLEGTSINLVISERPSSEEGIEYGPVDTLVKQDSGSSHSNPLKHKQ